jgi:PhnB protein
MNEPRAIYPGGKDMKKFKPDGWRTVTPRVITDDVGGLVGFLRAVFGADGDLRSGAPTEMTIGDSVVMISDGGDVRKAMPAFLYVYVENADETYKRAIAAGAESIESPQDMPYGDRRATVGDSWANIWQIATYRAR